jgi:Protein of unknown function (DUF2442)
VLFDIISARYLKDYQIEIVFEDGAKGIVDFSEYCNRGGVFNRFKDIEYFKNFKIDRELGVITWDDDVDIAPETLYAKATGRDFGSTTEAVEVLSNQTIK